MPLTKLPDLAAMRTILLHGYGVEARAALPWLLANTPADIVLADKTLHGVGLARVQEQLETQDAPLPDLYLRSPGIDPDNALFKKMRARHVPHTTPTGFWLAKAPHGPVITITGTKGKSTTASLVDLMLRQLSYDTLLLGNIGTPPFNADPAEDTVCIAELSSFMMYDLPGAPDVHIVTNLYKEHTDWHGGKTPYAQAKIRPFLQDENQPGLVGDGVADFFPAAHKARLIKDKVRLTGTILQTDDLTIDAARLNEIFAAPSMARAAQAALATCLSFCDQDTETITKAAEQVLRTYQGLPSRQAIISRHDGISWVDDALATVPEATLSALARFHHAPVHLIMGGKDRGQTFAPFFAGLDEKNLFITCFGEIAAPLMDAATAAKFRAIKLCDGLEQAIMAAQKKARAGDIILFSPAAPSEPHHGHYQNRAKIFADAAQQAKKSG